MYFIYFQYQRSENLNCEDLGNLFQTLVTLISIWLGISKISPPILHYRMLCVLSNNFLVLTVPMEHPEGLQGPNFHGGYCRWTENMVLVE